MEKEMEKVKTALEDFGKKVVDTVKKGKDEADKVTKIAQLKIEIGSLTRQQRELFQELGELFYQNLSRPTKKAEADITETLGHVKEIDKKISSLKRQMKATREDKPVTGRRGRPPKEESAGKAPAKRRGRPPKKSSAAGSSAPKRRGRPPKSAAAKAKTTGTARRGRPPKSAKTESS